MWQTVIAYLLVAGAAGWIAWSLFLPTAWRRRIRHPFRAAAGGGATPTADGCGCARDKV